MTARRTSFSDELRIIHPIAVVLAVLAFVGAMIGMQFAVAHDPKFHHAWQGGVFGLIVGVVASAWVLIIGYINQDAKRRGMGQLLWTLLAIFVPNCLGILLYFLLRKPRLQPCPACGTTIDPNFRFCPKCGLAVAPVCPHCGRGISHDFVCCPYCGKSVKEAAPSAPAPA